MMPERDQITIEIEALEEKITMLKARLPVHSIRQALIIHNPVIQFQKNAYDDVRPRKNHSRN